MEDRNMFLKIHESEKNEKTAFILMLGALSEKLSKIADLLIEVNNKLDVIGKCLTKIEKDKIELKDKKFYMPLTAEDYD